MKLNLREFGESLLVLNEGNSEGILHLHVMEATCWARAHSFLVPWWGNEMGWFLQCAHDHYSSVGLVGTPARRLGLKSGENLPLRLTRVSANDRRVNHVGRRIQHL